MPFQFKDLQQRYLGETLWNIDNTSSQLGANNPDGFVDESPALLRHWKYLQYSVETGAPEAQCTVAIDVVLDFAFSYNHLYKG